MQREDTLLMFDSLAVPYGIHSNGLETTSRLLGPQSQVLPNEADVLMRIEDSRNVSSRLFVEVDRIHQEDHTIHIWLRTGEVERYLRILRPVQEARRKAVMLSDLYPFQIFTRGGWGIQLAFPISLEVREKPKGELAFGIGCKP